MRGPKSTFVRLLTLAGVTALTLAIHYGWIIDPVFGHVHWIHAIHGRLCYVPIVISATWFGVRGGLYSAAVISTLVLPYIVTTNEPHQFANEVAEIVFYFAIGALVGLLVDREFAARRRQEEAQLNVERSQRLSLVGQFAACVAHEIKNPLASIKGAADIVVDEDTTQAEREEFKKILGGEVKRINATVGEFLMFARPKETRPEKVNLAEALHKCIRQMEPEIKRRGLTIDSEFEEDVVVDADPQKIHQMALNLLLNAIQASNEGDAIVVSLGREGLTLACVEISDSGAGMNTEDVDHAFEPFFTTKASGTGLGLAVVKEIVDSHQGTIGIDSRQGIGTTVSITLPCTRTGDSNEDSTGRR